MYFTFDVSWLLLIYCYEPRIAGTSSAYSCAKVDVTYCYLLIYLFTYLFISLFIY